MSEKIDTGSHPAIISMETFNAGQALERTAEAMNGKQSPAEVGALLEVLQAIRRSLERIEKIAEAQLDLALRQQQAKLADKAC